MPLSLMGKRLLLFLDLLGKSDDSSPKGPRVCMMSLQRESSRDWAVFPALLQEASGQGSDGWEAGV